MIKEISCTTCKHWTGTNLMRDQTCAAFPGGIPEAILYGDERHLTPFQGDHGVQYEPTATALRRGWDARRQADVTPVDVLAVPVGKAVI